jgi:RHS repeat-associated protein
MTGPPAGSTATYSYDALNHRVETTLGTSGTPTVFLYNLAGKRVSEWQNNGLAGLGFLKGHYYLGSRPVAYYTVANLTTMPTLTFEHQDWLGTERMRTTSTGVVLADYTSLPFGDNQTTVPVEHYVPGLLYDTDAAHYAMLDHDTETNTDHAEFRQYDNQQGRWMSPDPYMGSYDYLNPQSFDRYVYVSENPTVGADPYGLEYCVPFGEYNRNCHAPNFNGSQQATSQQMQAAFYASALVMITLANGTQYFVSLATWNDMMSGVSSSGMDAGGNTIDANGNMFDPSSGYVGTASLGFLTSSMPTTATSDGGGLPNNGWSWEEGKAYWPKVPPTRMQPFGKCFKNAWTATSLPAGVQAGAVIISAIGLVFPNPFSASVGASFTLFNFGRVVSGVLVCSSTDANYPEMPPGSAYQ